MWQCKWKTDQETEMWMAEWSETRAQGSSDGRTRKQTRKRKCAAPKLFFTENDLLCCRYWDQRQESQTNKRKCRLRSSREDRPCRSEDKKTQREQTNKRKQNKKQRKTTHRTLPAFRRHQHLRLDSPLRLQPPRARRCLPVYGCQPSLSTAVWKVGE